MISIHEGKRAIPPVLFTALDCRTLLPRKLYRGKSGIPYENQLLARVAFVAIGRAMLVLWYSLHIDSVRC
jgi:hypothetical protein